MFYQKLIDVHDSWIIPDDCAEDSSFWQFVKINSEFYTPIQDRRNSDGDIEYRIKPSFYEMFKIYFDKNIRPDM